MTDETGSVVTAPASRDADPAATQGTADGSAPPEGASPPRRRTRGGRGRGGRGGGTKTTRAARDAGEGADEVGGATTPASDAAEAEDATAGTPSAPRKRRRRGGRGRGRSKATATPVDVGASGDAVAPEPEVSPKRTRSRSAKASSADTGTAVSEPATSEGAGGGGKAGAAETTPRSGRRRSRTSAAEAPAAEAPAAEAGGAAPAEEGTGPSPKKRRRRGGRGRGKKAGTAQPAAGDGAEPVAAASAAPEGEQPVSTRLRRARVSRQARGATRRRREPLPVVPRITDKLMVITEHDERDQIAVLEGRDLVQHYVTRIGARSMVGNVYLGRVQNVLPGMEAAFIDVGRGRNAVLYAGEVNYAPEDLDGSPPRIEKVLKSGQSVLVQVTKDPIGGKGARLTAQVSMPGRYLVLVPNSNVTGISRRLPEGERRRLKAIYKKIRPEGHGLIVRTAAEGASEEALTADLSRLLDEWAAIEKRAKKAKAPAVLYEEPELTVRVVRDLFTDEEFRELVTDSPRVYEIVTDYLRQADPEVLPKVRLHQGPLPVFEEFHVVEQIHKGLDRKVWLPSGGYLVIDRTEALTVIDVNTGKSVGKTNLEETVVNTNIEAAREVARQLRLRDIGGMIVIDFIDMLLEQNKKRVIETLREALAQDKSRSQVFDISPLGLLEVTRKRVSGGLLESFSETCPTCEGRGVLLTYDVN